MLSGDFSFCRLAPVKRYLCGCSMKLEYLVNGKVTAYLKASKYSARRCDRFCHTCSERSYFFPLSLLALLIHMLFRIIICSSRPSLLLLSRVAFYVSALHLAYISTCIPRDILSFQFILVPISSALLQYRLFFFFDFCIIHVLVHHARYVRR